MILQADYKSSVQVNKINFEINREGDAAWKRKCGLSSLRCLLPTMKDTLPPQLEGSDTLWEGSDGGREPRFQSSPFWVALGVQLLCVLTPHPRGTSECSTSDPGHPVGRVDVGHLNRWVWAKKSLPKGTCFFGPDFPWSGVAPEHAAWRWEACSSLWVACG